MALFYTISGKLWIHRIKLGIILCLLLPFLIGSPSRAARKEKISFELQQRIEELAPGEKLRVIVRLHDQPDVSIQGIQQHKRSAALALALKEKATQSQSEILLDLRRGQVKGQVSQIIPFWIFNGFGLVASGDTIQQLALTPTVAEIYLDKQYRLEENVVVSATPAANIDLIRAPALWDLGFTGDGIVVANMDTGVSYTHPDLVSQWRGGTNSWFDPNGEHTAYPVDVDGHGTATMGVMVGRDASGKSIGVAPDAQWIAVKIFDDRGVATTIGIHQGFQWLLDPDGDPLTADAPDVVVDAWAFLGPGCDLEFQADLLALRAVGILPVFSAGNMGPDPASSRSPANNPEAFAVGAIDYDDQVYAYSSRGPSACDGSIYPDVVAPGVDITSSDLLGAYATESGTSLSAPHVAGGLALLLNAFPQITADLQAETLRVSAVDLGEVGPDHDYGYGAIDLFAAYQWLVSNLNPTPTATPTALPAPTPTSFVVHMPVIIQ